MTPDGLYRNDENLGGHAGADGDASLPPGHQETAALALDDLNLAAHV